MRRCPWSADRRSVAAGVARRSGPTTTRRTGSPTTASGSPSTGCRTCSPATSMQSSTPSPPTSGRANSRERRERAQRAHVSPMDRHGLVRGSAGVAGRRPVRRMITWRELWAETADKVGSRPMARWLCERAGGFDGDELRDALDVPATHRAVAHLDAMLARLEGGEPLQYVLGSWA